MSKSFTAGMKEFFGFRPGTSVAVFAAELRELSYEEKLAFHKMAADYGLKWDLPMKPGEKLPA